MMKVRFLMIGFLVLPWMVSGCASGKSVEAVNAPLVEDRYRLSADRQAFDQIRAEVPEDQRRENDELAFVLQWMGEVKHRPAEIREKFNSAVAKKRSVFQKDMTNARSEFVKAERRERETFQKESENSRRDFRNRKASADERKAFFDDLDQKRRDFYAGQRERRDAFEAEARDKRKNFDDYIREKTAEFNQEHRAYSKRYDDWKKDLETKKKGAETERRQRLKDADAEFREQERRSGRPLGTEE